MAPDVDANYLRPDNPPDTHFPATSALVTVPSGRAQNSFSSATATCARPLAQLCGVLSATRLTGTVLRHRRWCRAAGAATESAARYIKRLVGSATEPLRRRWVAHACYSSRARRRCKALGSRPGTPPKNKGDTETAVTSGATVPARTVTMTATSTAAEAEEAAAAAADFELRVCIPLRQRHVRSDIDTCSPTLDVHGSQTRVARPSSASLHPTP
jgi:hypothetical protein